MSTLIQITFEYQGRTRTLNKHAVVQQALRTGTITETEARLKPWYLRNAGQSFKLSANDRDAITQAKAHLKAAIETPTEWQAFVKERAAKRAVTFAELAKDWIAENMPDDASRPREQAARERLQEELDRALLWWGDKSAEATDKSTILTFARACRVACSESGRGTGERKADKELSALSSLCQWATAVGKISKNPFADRPRIQDSKSVKHCHLFMPDTDEDFHRVLEYLFTRVVEPNRDRDGKILSFNYNASADDCTFRLRCVGAWLAFTSLTGLRPEEPQYLYRFPRLDKPPVTPQKLPAGTIFPTRDGKWKMKVTRSKGGQNPYVLLHDAALDFLNCWESFLIDRFDQTKFAQAWFPNHHNPAQPLCSGESFEVLNHKLADACAALKLDKLRPKGFGRAYYVRVRRSQGQEDPLIAFELGQTTNGKLIRDTYGEPDDMLGGLTFDWQREDSKQQVVAPAWQLLKTETASNVIAITP